VLADVLMRAAVVTACALASACGDDAPDSARAEIEIGQRFVGELEFRRAALERSLAVTDNGDARLRLAHYGIAGEWEDLPVLNAEVAPIVQGVVPVFAPLWSGELEWNEPAVLELGRRAFEEWPAQRQPLLSSLLPAPGAAPAKDGASLDALGVWRDGRGRVGGLSWVRYADGTVEPALSCASCHARPDASGQLVHGPASDLDLGALSGEVWGAGLVDVTVDAQENPVAIPDLRATRHQQRLHHTGNLYNGLEALAVRTETLLITARAEAVRPPREVAFALAYYVWSLGRDERPAPAKPSQVFHDYCERCHSGPTGAGDVVATTLVGTDAAASASSARGSGGYRAPSLYRVSERTRLTHEGWSLTLEQLIDPQRDPTYQGHAFGFELAPEERRALVSELRAW
jgi:hypothetical protein